MQTSLPQITLWGIAITTNNATEFTANGKIAPTMQNFFSNVLGSFNSCKPNNVYAVYTNYESDKNGNYTYFIGQEVDKNNTNLPANLQSLTINPQNYSVFNNNGQLPEAVISLWQNIWGNAELEKQRKYTADFEMYTLDNLNQVSIYIAVN